MGSDGFSVELACSMDSARRGRTLTDGTRSAENREVNARFSVEN